MTPMNASSHQQTDTVKISVLLSHLLRDILTFFLEVIGLYQEKSPKNSTYIDLLNHVDPAQPSKTSSSIFAPSRPRTVPPTSKPPVKSKLILVLQDNTESNISEQRLPHSRFLSATPRDTFPFLAKKPKPINRPASLHPPLPSPIRPIRLIRPFPK